MRAIVADDPRESFFALYLDTRHRIIGVHTVSIGTLDSASVHPREVLGPALAMSAAAIIIAHNHPSGDPTPSKADNVVTSRLRQAAELLGIDFLDHVIVGESSFFSYQSKRKVSF